MKWNKRIAAMTLVMVFFLGLLPMQAFAMEDEAASTEATVQTEATEPVQTEPPQPSEPPESNGLTPEGNLTLVDDLVDTQSGKEFITVVSKNGNYFYIIIDRDADGNRTVHFLNLVDEADLLELLSEEQADAYQEEQATKPTEPPETVPTEPTEPSETTPSDPFDPEMDKETMILLLTPMVVLIIGGFAAYFIFGKKKPNPSPAQQAEEEDWDYDYDLPEESDDAPEEEKL